MRDSESLVKVHMTNVTSACSWVSQADLSIEVRAVEVDLATVLVYNLTSILNTIFEDTKSRRICDLLGNQRESSENTDETDHECRKVVLVLLSLCLEVFKVKSTIRQNFHRNNLQARHDSRLSK